MKLNIEKHKALYVIFLAMLAATPPLSTDMYLAAIPQIADTWNVGKDLANLTLVLWFAAFSFSILIAGSLSDKYGRKSILIVGLIIFVCSSFLCAISQNITQLILFRIFQGAGAAAPSAIVMAIIRDRFSGNERQQAIAYVMTIVAIAPMVAPLIGALLLEWFSWRFIFLLQGSMVLFTLLIALSFTETIQEKLTTPLLHLVTRYRVHFRNREFIFASLGMGLLSLPFYGFIAFSPIYYISLFGLSEKMFSLFFGLNALSSMSGAYMATKIATRFGDKKAITLTICGCILAATGLLLATQHYLFFLLFMALFSFSIGCSRPISGALILGLVKTDVGSASSFLIFYQFISGALCMAFVTYRWTHPVLVYALLTLVTSLLVLLIWKAIENRIEPTH
ncbi:multidrug effflux MFS transporter [uncultured Desulfuromusa sp.]|uniref:multidrug effflux MFS transporter n=1 Tax=uncultured Desulfuromusa sp. TaxID=219183 RepID=UPI002AA6DA7A|nr:multidrug effflux MFS transporter [uncultured Desulfuromusa sp.]